MRGFVFYKMSRSPRSANGGPSRTGTLSRPTSAASSPRDESVRLADRSGVACIAHKAGDAAGQTQPTRLPPQLLLR